MLLIVTLCILACVALIGCRKHKPPKAELCAYDSSEVVVCDDPRIPTGRIDRKLKRGDLCTSPESYERVYSYCAELRTKLIKCERRVE
jgi:hypothetical protein